MSTEREARRIVRTRSGGSCEVCDAARATDFAHRKSAGRGGLWCADNGVDLCRDCHRRCHANPEWAYARGLFVETTATPAGVPVRLRYGRVFLRADGQMLAAPDMSPLPPDIAEALALAGPDGEEA